MGACLASELGFIPENGPSLSSGHWHSEAALAGEMSPQVKWALALESTLASEAGPMPRRLWQRPWPVKWALALEAALASEIGLGRGSGSCP